MSILHHSAADAPSNSHQRAESTHHREYENLRPRRSTCSARTEPQAAAPERNYNVWNILPVTTLRTIDLQGKKNSDRLFSRFCAERELFFEVFYAPEMVQLHAAPILTVQRHPHPLAQLWRVVKLGYCGFVFLISSRSRLIETSSATAIPPDSIASFHVIPNFLRLI